MALKLGSSFESWLDRKIEVLKAEGILRSKFNNLKRHWSVVSEDEHSANQSQSRSTDTRWTLNDHTIKVDNPRRDLSANMSNVNYFPDYYKDDPSEVGQPGHVYSDDPDVGSGDSPRDISPQSDYYKFTWQEDEDFEAALGPPSGASLNYPDDD